MNLLLITTGGTISCVKKNNKLQPELNEVICEKIKQMDSNLNVSFINLFNIDSSNMQPEEWQILATKIYENIFDYDAILITHGTDTMHYTSSMLSFMIQNPPIPIILTGSQLPLNDILTDAYSNLRYSIGFAKSKTKGIYLVFNRKVILGTRAVKVRKSSFYAFESINKKNIASIDSNGLNINYDLLVNYKNKPILNTNISTDIFLLRITPTTDPSIIQLISNTNVKAIVIEAYGKGGISNFRRDYIKAIEYAIKKNIIICMTSQCLYEESDFTIYEVSDKISKLDILFSYDMTTESIITKLMHLLGNYTDYNKIKELFYTSIAGENKYIN